MTARTALEALKRNDFAAARAAVAGIAPDAFDTPLFLMKGLAELAMEDWSAACATFTAAAARFPDYALFWLNKGVAEENLQRIDAAIASHEKCLALNPAQAEAFGNLANLYRKQKRFALSEKMARRALDLGAAGGDALNSLGLALSKQGRHAEADVVFAEAMREIPPNPFVVLNRANLAADRLRFDEAWPLFAQARSLSPLPVMRRDEGMARLLAGDYAAGWPLHEARLEMPYALRMIPDCPLWRGENLAGKKLLIIAEQGFGDVIQFCRYGALLPEDVEMVWAVPSVLVRLLAGSLRGAVLDEKSPLPVCDYYAPVMSLAFMTERFMPSERSVPSPPHLISNSVVLLPPGPQTKKIGLVWAGSRTHERDHERSIPLSLLAPLVQSTAADFYAPFTGDALNEIRDLPITRLDHLMNDFADTAALLAQMDCLITVDTVAAHLAGALGVPTFLLLPYCPDWRWGIEGETTPWYPSLTLLRQPAYGDWGNAITKIPLFPGLTGMNHI